MTLHELKSVPVAQVFVGRVPAEVEQGYRWRDAFFVGPSFSDSGFKMIYKPGLYELRLEDHCVHAGTRIADWMSSKDTARYHIVNGGSFDFGSPELGPELEPLPHEGLSLVKAILDVCLRERVRTTLSDIFLVGENQKYINKNIH